MVSSALRPVEVRTESETTKAVTELAKRQLEALQEQFYRLSSNIGEEGILVVDLMTPELTLSEAEDLLLSVGDYTPGPFLFFRSLLLHALLQNTIPWPFSTTTNRRH
mmetsp:Transcript_54067/g.113019  ORF Transcript_54067/g.113019 Transcript_54067/m.113019 type:complete len:107 (-) Transcript_54067:1709-2029(-)